MCQESIEYGSQLGVGSKEAFPKGIALKRRGKKGVRCGRERGQTEPAGKGPGRASEDPAEADLFAE